MTSEQSLGALGTRINTLNDEVIRLQERSRARDDEIKRLKADIEAMQRWIARGLMVGGSLGTGAAYILFKQIAESAGISL